MLRTGGICMWSAASLHLLCHLTPHCPALRLATVWQVTELFAEQKHLGFAQEQQRVFLYNDTTAQFAASRMKCCGIYLAQFSATEQAALKEALRHDPGASSKRTRADIEEGEVPPEQGTPAASDGATPEEASPAMRHAPSDIIKNFRDQGRHGLAVLQDQ